MKFRGVTNLLGLTRPTKKRGGERSKYKPHQGEREKLRRRLGGFHNERRIEALRQKEIAHARAQMAG